MKNKIFFAVIPCLLFSACSHPSAPSDTPLSGTVVLETDSSNFGNAWVQLFGVDGANALFVDENKTSLTVGGTYTFGPVSNGKHTIFINYPGYVTWKLYSVDPSSSAGIPYAFLYPPTFLRSSISAPYVGTDTIISSHRSGVVVNSHGDTTNYGTLYSDTSYSTNLRIDASDVSVRGDRNSNASLTYLYISTTSNIDPSDPTTYDEIYSYGVGPNDSTYRFELIPEFLHTWTGFTLPAGTHVYCQAFAYPNVSSNPSYIGNNVSFYSYQDSTGKKSVYPYLAGHPSNTIEFNLP
jgi:hypothetical protein